MPLNNGWTLKDTGHRAIVDFGELRINGATLADEKRQKALKAVVFAAAAYNDAGEAYDALVRSETQEGKVLIYTDNLDEKSDIGLRGDLLQKVNTTELLLVSASEFFLALYQGREPEDMAFTYLSALTETFLGTENKRDALVS